MKPTHPATRLKVMTPAEILLAAADRIDQARAEASPGGWRLVAAVGVGQAWSDGTPRKLGDPFAMNVAYDTHQTNYIAELNRLHDDDFQANAAWIALMDPTTGAHIAALLRLTGNHVDTRGMDCQCCDSALALARHILDKTGGPT